jgi:putative ABC transport system permease protein
VTLDNIRIALHGIWANRLRSSLTTLGIMIGVAAVIVLVAVGNGAARFVQQQIELLGTNTLFVIPTSGLSPGGGNRTGTASRQIELTTEDVRALRNKVNAPDIAAVSPEVNAPQITGEYRGSTYTPERFLGVTEEYFEIGNSKTQSGTLFTEEDVRQHRKAVVLGSTVVTNLFSEGADPIGEIVKFSGVNFRVVGVLERQSGGGFQDANSVVIAPLTTVQDTLTGNTGSFATLTVQAVSRDRIDAAQAQILSVLASTHDLSPGEVGEFFTLVNQATLLETTSQFTTVFTLLLGAVAAISLLVGGIGVMNIMLVTVTERIREIGIRKAIGARRGDILGQFLVEAVLLTGLGGTLGVAVGLAAGQLRLGTFALVVRPFSVVLAFGVAVAVGLFFGIYPANRAASLNPVEALRYE